jgi:hypothetical protein
MRTLLSKSRPLSLGISLAALLGCASEPPPAPVAPCPAPPPPVAAAAAPAVAPAPAAVPVPEGPVLKACANGMQPGPDGLFDDLEDNNSQVALVDGRSGYWWQAHAPHASFSAPGPEFRVSDGGPTGSKKTAHVAGKTDVADIWGASLGANFLGGGFYDMSKYAGISFKIKGTAKGFVRFKIHDISTHPDGGVCKECWNAFGKTIELTGDWQTLELPFAELTQQMGWGSPHPPQLNTTKVKHLEWSVDQGIDFDFSVDDIKLLVCK